VLAYLRRILPFLSILILVAVAYDGYIFYSRWKWRQEAAHARTDAEAERDRKVIAAIGGTGFQIRNFYASPLSVRQGQAVSLCYSVSGATTLHLDPPLAEVYPAFSHCVQASPRQDTEFKLTATDSSGHTATAKVMVRVAH